MFSLVCPGVNTAPIITTFVASTAFTDVDDLQLSSSATVIGMVGCKY